MLERLIALVKDQQAGSVIGAVGTSVGGFGAGVAASAALGSGTGYAPSTMTIGGGGTGFSTATNYLPAPTVLAAGEISYAPPATISIGGEPSYANDPLMRAAIAAQDRGDTALASQFLGVQSGINESRNRSIALITAPSGARALGPYGPSSGYRSFGSYLEVPI